MKMLSHVVHLFDGDTIVDSVEYEKEESDEE